MQCHAHAKNMCLHNVLHTAVEPPTQRDGTLYGTSAGQYVRNNARTHHTIAHCACAFSEAKASHILDICTFAKCCTICSLRPAHSAKAQPQFTCAALNSSACEAMN